MIIVRIKYKNIYKPPPRVIETYMLPFIFTLTQTDLGAYPQGNPKENFPKTNCQESFLI